MFRKIKKSVILIYQWFIFSVGIFNYRSNYVFYKFDLFDKSLIKSYDKKWKYKSFVNVNGMELNEIIIWFDSEKSNTSMFHPFLKISDGSGIDVKEYWEIGRLNFLTEKQLLENNFIENEVINIISLSSLCKVGFGIQWKCAMDVAIRLVNLVLLNNKNSLLISNDKKYLRFLDDSVEYILLNLEKYGDWRGNHYLTNLVGLLICAAHNDSNRAKKVFDFALFELDTELDRQFLSDGSNFEGSTAYHFFGLELISVLHTVLKSFNYEARSKHYTNPYIITNLGLKKCQFSPLIFRKVISKLESKIEKALDFSASILDSNGCLIQIGDNDSGRVFRTCYLDDYIPDFYADIFYQVRESLKNGTFPCLVENRDFYLNYLNRHRNELISSECGLGQLLEFNKKFISVSEKCKKTHIFRLGSNSSEFKIKYFDCFGLVVARSDNSIITFRCGPIGQLGKGGHDHYDQLSITLTSDGHRVIADPGVGCYTKDVDIRNKYRSSKSHFGVHGKKDFDDISNLFRIHSTGSKLLAVYHDEILGFQKNDDVEKYRKIELFKDKIIVKDIIINDELANCYEKIPYSPGYGIIEYE
ncbi:heparinase II/III domain-containing protein [Vibrio cholerae]|uniref:heparinase II/III domain-containing protein n=1 Tax=Vibrio cholerae TaxID=666 RepID=UPI00115B1878|nr:heparinase II/III family protein [Vibrio cholerae]TQP93804.1 hypothetical protein FLL73_16605 [Vibrio cholerae]